jgi:hypothetical protein
MAVDSDAAPARPSLVPAAAALVVGALLIVFTLDRAVGSLAALGAVAVFAFRARVWWLAACAAAWALVFLSVLTFPGPYDSWAGRAAIPVLAGYALCFLGGWALGRRLAPRDGDAARPAPADDAARPAPADDGARPAPADDGARPARADDGARPALVWPSERRLRWYLLALLVVGLGAAILRFHGTVPPLFAANPDAARQALSQRANITEGLLSEAWTLGVAVSLLRALTGQPRWRWLYLASTAVFTSGAALGASKNSVLVGIIPAVAAALSVRRHRQWVRPSLRTGIIVGVGLAAVGTAVILGGQRTLAGTGAFEDEFRARYGANPVAASVASLDLSLSSPAETFGRLWAQRDALPPRWGAYTLKFLGRRGEPFVGRTDLYGITGQLSAPYYMNTATFVAIPLLDWGPAGAVLFLLVLGVGVGFGDRSLEFSSSPAYQLGRGFIVYFAAFGIYELYPAIYPTWLSLVPGLWLLDRLGRAAR